MRTVFSGLETMISNRGDTQLRDAVDLCILKKNSVICFQRQTWKEVIECTYFVLQLRLP